MHAVGGRAGDVVHAGLGLEQAQRHIEREGIAGAAAIAVRRHHRDLAERAASASAQARDALGPVAVIVADEYFHGQTTAGP